jgi:hypothetical protein
MAPVELRSLLPAGLVEEIRALSSPPIPGEAQLDARTFGEVLDTSGSMWWRVRGSAFRVSVTASRRRMCAPASHLCTDHPLVTLVLGKRFHSKRPLRS